MVSGATMYISSGTVVCCSRPCSADVQVLQDASSSRWQRTTFKSTDGVLSADLISSHMQQPCAWSRGSPRSSLSGCALVLPVTRSDPLADWSCHGHTGSGASENALAENPWLVRLWTLDCLGGPSRRAYGISNLWPVSRQYYHHCLDTL